MDYCSKSVTESFLIFSASGFSVLQHQYYLRVTFITFRVFLRKMLGTRYGSVGTRFSLIFGTR